jgi:transcriptional regulator with XRE-family HTH domain
MAKRLLEGASPIKLWREHRGLSQRQLAEAVGARATYVSQLETGRKRPSLDMAIALARTLSVTVDALVGGPAD